MGKYIIRRLISGIVSIIIVVGIVMLLVFAGIDRNNIFMHDPNYTKVSNNDKIIYRYQKWEEYGYLDFVQYTEYLNNLVSNGTISEDEKKIVQAIGRTAASDSDAVKEYVNKFTEHYQKNGYTVQRLDAVTSRGQLKAGGAQRLIAYKDTNVFVRMWKYFTGLVRVDNIHYASGIPDSERKIYFTWHDPAYGGKFAPAIMGNGTQHKYLLYFDNKFPFIHQNLVTIQLGQSFSVNAGVDVWDTMTDTQGGLVFSDTIYPTGLQASSADDLHSATYVEGSRDKLDYIAERFTDDYTNVKQNLDGRSRMSNSFVIGILSVIMAYILGLPLGILMALKKDKIADKLGKIYIIFIIAVPSLAYIFMFSAIGGAMGLPTRYDVTAFKSTMLILPIVSLALPSIAGLMNWMRRYMIDQSNSDYVKFARSGGLSEGQIFRKHIMKNAAIPIVHGIPGSVLGALTGAIITESVYVVPGVGNVLTQAIGAYDNTVIVGVSLFYAVLSVISLILGDVLMALIDPRISFTTKAR